MKNDHKLLKIAGVLLLSAVMLLSASAVTANTGDIATKHSVQKIGNNIPSNPFKSVSRGDDIIWDMVADESWTTFEYREMVFDLSSYAGRTIQIAWRYVGIDGDSFGLDDINVDADSSAILTQGFEAGLMPPTGWTVINTNPTRNWDLVDAVTYPDFVHSGVYAAWVNYDTPNPSDEWLTTPEIDLSGFTTVSLSFWAESDTQYPTATMELHILYSGGGDTTPPVTTSVITGTNPVTITLTATDADSGVNYTTYKIDDGSYATYTGPVEVTEVGDHVVYFYSVDFAGNVETEKNAAFTVEAPPISITIKGGFGVSATIKNTGTADLTDIDWTIALDGKLIFVGKAKSGTIAALAAGEEVIVKDFVIGVGKTGIAVTAGAESASASGTALLFFVIGV
ncbi:MAG: choice-of-anchor J domain-containing protein [Euryarchaeota archaeon]|nr:choice-of-anchor J domain-containing protein [Euryarchaeota archaeon]